MKHWTQFLTLAALAALMSGCGAKVTTVNPDELADNSSIADQSAAESAAEATEQEPREVAGIMLFNNINTIHPNKVEEINAASVVNMIGEGLYRQNKAGGYERGILVQEPEKIAERTYRLHIKDDAKWSDGTPVVAADLVLSWQSLVDPARHNSHGDLLNGVVAGATAIQQGKQAPETLGITAKDDKTVELTLEQPIDHYPTFKTLFARCELFPLPSHKLTSATDYKTYGDNADNVFSNGPYVIKNWQTGGWNGWQLMRNPYYDQQADYPTEQIEVHVADDFKMIQPNFTNQLVDLAPNFEKPENTAAMPWNETRYLAFNLADDQADQDQPKDHQNVVSDPQLRQLLLAPLDLTATIQQLTKPAQIATDLVPMTQGAGQASEKATANPKALNDLLDQYGYEALELTLLVQNDNDDVKLAETIKTQIEKAYDRVVIDVVPMRNEKLVNRQLGIVDYRDARYAEHYDMIIQSHVQADEKDQYSQYASFASQSPANHLGIADQTVDNILAHYSSANATLTSDDQQQLETALRQSHVVLPLYDTFTRFTQSVAIRGEATTKAGYLYDFKGMHFTAGDATIPKTKVASESSK